MRLEQSAHIRRFIQVAGTGSIVTAGSTGFVIILLYDQCRLLVGPTCRRLNAWLLLLNQNGLRLRRDNWRKLLGNWLLLRLHLNAGVLEGLFLQSLADLWSTKGKTNDQHPILAGRKGTDEETLGTYTVRPLIRWLTWFRSSLKRVTAERSISISSSVHLLLGKMVGRGLTIM